MNKSAVPHVSVLTPVYRNADTLQELYQQIKHMMDRSNRTFELIFVCDASPDESWAVIQKIAQNDPCVAGMCLHQNAGQQCALLNGLFFAHAEAFITLDADLQDPPGAIPSLLDGLAQGYGAVFAGRRGYYQNGFRMLTSRLYKNTLHLLCGVPKDAGLYIAFNQAARSALLAYPPARTHLAAMLGCAGIKLKSIPVPRNLRPSGTSAYSNSMRLKAAWDGISWVLKWKLSRSHPTSGFKPSPADFCGEPFDLTR
ncbi:MAG TPA: glycosyltransferase [Longilinea sp.]|nr:glycosyltransferase [Longilinea sp.]